MRKLVLALLLSGSANAHDIAIELGGDTGGFLGHLFTVRAKYYQRMVNPTDKLGTYCYRIDLCIENIGCGKGFQECVNVKPKTERLIGKELTYTRTIDFKGRYYVTARSTIIGSKTMQRQAYLDIW